MLGLLALVGFFAIAGVAGLPEYALASSSSAITRGAGLLLTASRLVFGIAFAAIGIGALSRRDHVDAAKPLHAHIHREFITRIRPTSKKRDGKGCRCRQARRPRVHHFRADANAIYLQLLGGIWIIRRCPRWSSAPIRAGQRLGAARWLGRGIIVRHGDGGRGQLTPIISSSARRLYLSGTHRALYRDPTRVGDRPDPGFNAISGASDTFDETAASDYYA